MGVLSRSQQKPRGRNFLAASLDCLRVEATKSGSILFIEPMYALAVQNIPEGKDWLYEVKFDGYRCLAGRDQTAVTLWSRRGNLFTNPEIYRG